MHRNNAKEPVSKKYKELISRKQNMEKNALS